MYGKGKGGTVRIQRNHYGEGRGGMEPAAMGGMGPSAGANYGWGWWRRHDDELSATGKPKTMIIPSSPRGAKLREELLRKIVPWNKITVSFDNFLYYIE